MTEEENKKLSVGDEDEDTVEAKLETAGIIAPPDGGFGWVVVVASFFANLFVDGIIFTTGQSLLSLWQKEFETTAMAASWAQALLGGCYLLAGPLASALANHFGCRVVTIAGTVLAFIGFMLSALVPALPLLYFTFGIVGGIGFGLVYLPAIVIVNQYFEKRRALALGLAVCGSGIGTTIFSQIFPFLLRLNDGNWRTCLMNVAVITLLCILCGLCFKNPPITETQVEQVAKIAVAYHEAHTSKTSIDKQSLTGAQPNGTADLTLGLQVPEVAPRPRSSSVHRVGNKGLSSRPFLSTLELHASKRSEKGLWSPDTAKTITRKSMYELNRPLSKMSIFYTGSTVSLSRRIPKSDSHGRGMPSGEPHYLSASALQTCDEAGESDDWKKDVGSTVNTMFDVTLFQSPSFIILAISGFLTLCCLFVPFIYLGEQASQVGVSKDRQAFLLTSLGVINIVGRVICGIISDLPSVDPLMVSNVAIISGGIGTFCVPLLTEYWMYVVYTVPFALAVAAFSALRSVIVVELLGLERLSSAFGLLLLFMGMAALIGPPTAAFLKDLTGNFDLSFYVMGFLLTMSGVICVPLRRVSAYEQRRRKTEANGNMAELQPLKA